MKSNFLCLSENDADLRVFHFQRRVLGENEGLGLGVRPFFLMWLSLRCFFFVLYLIFFFLFFSVFVVLEGSEVNRGVEMGVGHLRVVLLGIAVWRLVSLVLFLFFSFSGGTCGLCHDFCKMI